MNNKVICLYPRLTKWMGGSRFLYDVLFRLNMEREVILIVQREDVAVTNKFRENGIKTICLNSPSFTEIKFWLFFSFYLKSNFRKIKAEINHNDIIISFMFPMNYLATMSGLPHIQIVYEPFAMFFDDIWQKNHSFLLNVFCKIIKKLFSKNDILSVQKANQLLTLSEFEYENCLRIYDKKSKIIYEGVDTNFFYPRKSSKLDEKYKAQNILFHSTGYDSYKGTDHLIKALPLILLEHPDTLTLISHTREDNQKRNMYSKFLKSNNIEHKVLFLGFIDFERLPEYYSIANLYLEPGINRSMSLSSKEANACGTPSVRGEIGTEDTIDGFTGILTSSTDEEILANDVIKLLNDKKYIETLGRNAKEHVLKNYTWDIVLKRIDDSIINL